MELRGVEHDADTQRQVGLLGEAKDLDRGAAIVEQAEVFTLQAGDEAALFIRDGEDEVDLVDPDDDLVRVVGVGRSVAWEPGVAGVCAGMAAGAAGGGVRGGAFGAAQEGSCAQRTLHEAQQR